MPPTLLLLLLFLLLFLAGFRSGVTAAAPPSSPPPHVNIAFHITVSPSQLPRLDRLLLRLYHPHNHYLIDYDASIPLSAHLSETRPNVFHRRADPSIEIGVSHVLNILDAMAFFLNLLQHHPQPSWHYFIPLTPDLYPTLTPINLRQLLVTPDNPSKAPSFFHFAHPSQQDLFSSQINHHFVDLALSFNTSITPRLHTSAHPHPDSRRRTFQLPRADVNFVASHHFVKHAVDSILSKRLLLTLSETSHVSTRFFSSFAHAASPADIGPVVRTASLHCIDSHRLDQLVQNALPIHDEVRPPSIPFLFNSSRPCLFAAPIPSQDRSIRDLIDRNLLIPPGTQGRPPGQPYHQVVRQRLATLLASL